LHTKIHIRNYILSILSGVLLVLGFPKFDLWSLSWVALVPLLIAINEANWKQSLWLGFVAGGVYFFGIMNWLMVLVPFSTFFWVSLGYIVLSTYLACYVFMFTVSIRFILSLWNQSSGRQYPVSFAQKLAYIFLVGITWTGLEVIRGHIASGLPWASLGYTQWKILPIIQVASLTGMYGVTFLIALFNGVVAVLIIDIRNWKESFKSAIIPLAIIIASLGYGIISLTQPTDSKTIKVGLVPGNIKQKDKMASWGDKANWIFDKYIQATQKVSNEKLDMLVWPETAVPQYMFPESDELNRIRFLLSRLNTYMLMGALSYERAYPEVKYYNSAFILTPKGEIIDKYDKIHLVPVSEQFPFRRYLPKKIQEYVKGVSDFDSGTRYTVFNTPLGNIGVPICFESVFPEISREFINRGANLIAIITNDSWFIGTFAAEQHFSTAPFRAIENRVSVFRCANYGVSCIIDPYGRITKKLTPKENEEYLIGDVGVYQAGTFYTKHGDYLPWTCLAMLLFFIIQTWWYGYRKFMKKQGELNANRGTLSDSGNKRKGHGSRRSSLTSQRKKKNQKN